MLQCLVVDDDDRMTHTIKDILTLKGYSTSVVHSGAEALANQLLGELAGNLAAYDGARRTAALVETQLIPQSELSLRSALAAYETGKVDFATLLDAQRQIRKARMDRLKAQVDAQMRLAEIERIVGEDL